MTLAACATLDRGECEAGDWQQYGYADAASGRGSEFLGLHQRACAKHGVNVIGSEYQQGYRRGLLDFCVPATGWQLGLRGDDYHYLCPAAVEADFLLAYRDGLSESLASLHHYGHQLEDRLWHARVHRIPHRSSPAGTQDDTASDTEKEVRQQRRLIIAIESKLDRLRSHERRIEMALSRAVRHLRALADA